MTMRVWEADEDGSIQHWVVARSEADARATLEWYGVLSDDTEELTIEAYPDDRVLKMLDEDEPEDAPEGATIERTEGGWRVSATAAAWAAHHTEPVLLASCDY